MKESIRTNPNYPFAEAKLESTVREVDEFISDPPLSGAERGEVLEFVRLTRQYAFLERIIQGHVLCELPVHFDLGQSAGGSPEDQAERSATAERSLLGLGLEPAEDLATVLDERGIKVFRRTHGPEPPEKLTGAFYFVGELGPSLLVSAAGGCPEAVFILAHEFGHLVMDIDPYKSRFCRWSRRDLCNVIGTDEELRADRFARALLLPPATVRECAAAGVGGCAGSEESIRAIAQFFNVAPAVLWHRLGDLGLKRPSEPPRIRQEDCDHEVDDRRPTDLPERFVNLALSAFGQRILGRRELARFLRIPSKRLEMFLEWCPIPQAPRDELEDADPLEGEDEESTK